MKLIKNDSITNILAKDGSRGIKPEAWGEILKDLPVPNDPIRSTGARIRRLRESLGLARPGFAAMIGFSALTLKNYELGYRGVDYSVLRNILALFKKTREYELTEYLVFGDQNSVRAVPKISNADLAGWIVSSEGEELSAFDEDDFGVCARIKDLRVGLGLSRNKFVERFEHPFPTTTLKNYERMVRRPSYFALRHIAEHATDRVAAWNYLTMGPSETTSVGDLWVDAA